MMSLVIWLSPVSLGIDAGTCVTVQPDDGDALERAVGFPVTSPVVTEAEDLALDAGIGVAPHRDSNAGSPRMRVRL